MAAESVATTISPTDAEANVRKNVRTFLAVKGMTSADLARHLGMATSRCSERMTGKVRFTIAELWDIAHFLDVPVELFFLDPEEALFRSRWFSRAEVVEGQLHLLDVDENGAWLLYNRTADLSVATPLAAVS